MLKSSCVLLKLDIQLMLILFHITIWNIGILKMIYALNKKILVKFSFVFGFAFCLLRFILTRKCLYYISERPIIKSHCFSRDSFSRSDWFLIKYELNRESKKKQNQFILSCRLLNIETWQTSLQRLLTEKKSCIKR